MGRRRLSRSFWLLNTSTPLSARWRASASNPPAQRQLGVEEKTELGNQVELSLPDGVLPRQVRLDEFSPLRNLGLVFHHRSVDVDTGRRANSAGEVSK